MKNEHFLRFYTAFRSTIIEGKNDSQDVRGVRDIAPKLSHLTCQKEFLAGNREEGGWFCFVGICLVPPDISPKKLIL